MNETVDQQAVIAALTAEVEKLRAVMDVLAFDIKKPLRQVLRERREELGMYQRELAERLGMVPNYISMIETGAVAVPRRRLEDIANVLGINRREILAYAILDDLEKKKKKSDG